MATGTPSAHQTALNPRSTSPIQHLLASGVPPSDLLGPLGHFSTPTMAYSTSATDLVKSRLYSATSRLLPPTSLTSLHPPSFPPPSEKTKQFAVDRIAGNFTPSASKLNMKGAKKVADRLQITGNPTVTSTPSVTAPAAYTLAAALRSGTYFAPPSDEEDSRAGPTSVTNPLSLTTLSIPDTSSPQTLRTKQRTNRSPPRQPISKPVHQPVKFSMTQDGEGKDMDEWDPMVFTDSDNGNGPSNTSVAPNTSNQSPSNIDSADRAADPAAYIDAAYAQEQSIANYDAALQNFITAGAPNATGTGSCTPLVTLSPANIQGIIGRLAQAMDLPSNGDLAGTTVSLVAARNARLDTLFDAVSLEYSKAVAQSMLNYALRSPFYAASLSITPAHLTAAPCWWTDKTYQSHSWTILRSTGVAVANVHAAFVSIEHRLCTTEDVMLDLQTLWRLSRLPPDWEVNTLTTKDTNATRDEEGNAIVPLPPTYSDLNFTNVGQIEFRDKLPMTIETFAGGVEKTANAVREALRECWVTAAGSILARHTKDIVDDPNPVSDPAQQPPNGLEQPSIDGSLQSATSSVQYDNWQQSNDPALGRTLLNERIAAENLDDDLPPLPPDTVPLPVSFSRVQGIFDAASTLMSRQLRESTETSLETFAHFFTRFADKDDSGDSAFKLTLKINSDFQTLKKSDPEYDPHAPPTPCVTLEPAADVVKDLACGCIDQIMDAASRFPRPDAATTNEPLGPCTVAETDEIIRRVKNDVCDAIDQHYKKPQELVTLFNEYEELLSGEKEEQVLHSLEPQKDDGNVESTVVTLEHLFKVCADLTEVIESIKTTSPDLCYYPMFMVNCYDVKALLSSITAKLRTTILDRVAVDNRGHMTKMGVEYTEIVHMLTTDPADAQELKALQEYAVKSMDDLGRLIEEYLSEVYERVKFLIDEEYKISREDLSLFYTTYCWPNQVKSFKSKSDELQNSRKRELELVVEGQQEHLSRDIANLDKKVEKLCESSSIAPNDVQNIYKRIQTIKEGLDEAEAEAESIAEKEVLLEIPSTDNLTEIKRIRVNLAPLDKMWSTTKEFVEKSIYWSESPLGEVNPEDAEREADDLLRSMVKIAKELDRECTRVGESRATPKRAAVQMRENIKTFLEDQVPLMLLICNPGIRDRHWKQIEQLTLLVLPISNQTNLSQMIDLNLHHHVAAIDETCISASKENTLELGMDKMETEWGSMEFTLKDHRNSGTYILVGIDEIQQLLDDHIVKSQAMSSSRYVKPFLERITIWAKTLDNLQDILDNWLKMQATWLYLEPIFSSDDIMRQMPREGKLFRSVDSVWREAMKETKEKSGVIHTAHREGLLASLIEANRKLDEIQKGLNDYLETKMIAFPRFFFLSNDELLEILAETKEPRRVQPYMKKCFDGINEIEFADNLDIMGMKDGMKEFVKFEYEACNHKLINPSDSGGNVEKWLVEVEAVMRKSLAHTIDLSMEDYTRKNFLVWLREWQGQVVLAVNQVQWTNRIEAAIIQGQTIGAKKAIGAMAQDLADEVLSTVLLVRTKITKLLRVSCGALVVLHVHNRDTTAELTELAPSDIGDFDLLAQLRYYWKGDGESAQSGLPGTIDCCMINAHILYAYEYLGCNGRLVITPLTDRCYRTLMGAIHLNLGGAPEGPAGTGKTETTKDLGKAIAIQCVVTNCSDGLDYLAMEKFFKGLSSSGAWACFDEFNRIILEVLSVVAQQILQIQIAKARLFVDDLPGNMFTFGGTELKLKPTCCPFITMNPGYAGRAELPDNLKVLFRTVAMMVPDYAMIGEILLYSMGYENAKPLAAKIVTTYKLCSEQLSSQSHYDYGMRAVISVLRAAGNLKQTPDGAILTEDILVLRSIIDVNLPKFLSPDVPLFEGITGDLFPGVVVPPPDRDVFHMAFVDCCEIKNLQPDQYFYDKIVQIYDMMVVRHGFMIVGHPYSGKTCAWRILADMLGMLHQRQPDEPLWTNVIPFLMNPKSISMLQLYGNFDPTSHEWSDGVLPIQYRNAATSRVGKPEDRKWVLFDGPVDAIWIENMNTVLDDNKKLCLMSGEIIAMSDVMSMMFEPMDLLVASPATVSRCGMVYLEPEQVGWQPLLKSWIRSWTANSPEELATLHESRDGEHCPFFTANEPQLLFELFAWVVEPLISFVRKESSELVPTVDANLAFALMNNIECMLAGPSNKAPVFPDTDDAKAMKRRQQDIECCFMQSSMWSIGGSSNPKGQAMFDLFFKAMIEDKTLDCIDAHVGVTNLLGIHKWPKPDFSSKSGPEEDAPDRVFKGDLILPMPTTKTYFDYVYNVQDGKWRTWEDTLEKFVIPDTAVFADIAVTNKYTAQFSYYCELLLTRGKLALFCGPTGTGKSTYVLNTITKEFDQSLVRPITIGFSAKTSALMTQDIIHGKLDKRRKGIYGPPKGQRAIVFVDDLNMPEVETYGAQPPIELLRQMIDNGGYYDLTEKSWLTVVDTTLVSAMGPPGGGRNGVTPRLLRHFNLMCFGEFDTLTLQRIFTTIADWYFSKGGFSSDITGLTKGLVNATLEGYMNAIKVLLPTPAKSHYVFNLRDFSRVMQGVMMVRNTGSHGEDFTKPNFVCLWMHEMMRVFCDRLVNDDDRVIFLTHCEQMVTKHFDVKSKDMFQHLDTNKNDVLDLNDLRNLFFGVYMAPEDMENKPYEEVQDLALLTNRIDFFLEEHNAASKKPMPLVMFQFAIEHVSRISRVLNMDGGNALLVGVGGSGRQSVARLATFIAGFDIFQIEISKNYNNDAWREDLKTILRCAGTGAVPYVFLFSDTQIKNESFVEDINNILNSGEVPNLFPNDEKMAIVEASRPWAKRVYGKAAADLTIPEIFAFFVKRVRKRLHVLLAFSPIGDAFRERLRLFPSLINCCAIDWFTAWPEDALVAVADRFISEVKFDEGNPEVQTEMVKKVVDMCQLFHMSSRGLSEEFLERQKRHNYVTPTSYLELLMAFKGQLGDCRSEVDLKIKRYGNGLEKLAFAETSVGEMQVELTDLQPVLVTKGAAVEKLMAEVEEMLPGVRETQKVVGADAAVAQAEADRVGAVKSDVEADLAEAIPALNDAVKALDTIKASDIDEIKKLSKPPATVKLICEGICIFKDVKGVKIPDPDDSSKRIIDFWGPSQKMLGEKDFIASLKKYDKDNIHPKIVKTIRNDYMTQENFTIASAKNASNALAGLCKWAFAMITYDRVAKVVGPKRVALKEAEQQLEVTMAGLTLKKEALKEIEDKLEGLESALAGAKKDKGDLEFQVDLCGKKLIRAEELINGLGGEKTRWGQFKVDLSAQYINLTGDVLVSSGIVSYLGPFTSIFREKQVEKWVKYCLDSGIPSSAKPSLTNTLGDPVKIRQWNIDGLPTDGFSVDNGIVVHVARRWPLMIDPQGQANKWVRNMEKDNGLKVCKPTDGDFLRTLENSVNFGVPVLMENVMEEMDPSLEPLLLKQTFKQGGVICIKLGVEVVEYSDAFRFYMTTKLPNPHYLPEVAVKVTLLNFMITPEGLNDQLLGIVVSQERPDLEEKKAKLILDGAENKAKLQAIEDEILQILSSSEGNILEDASAIEALKSSKIVGDDIKEKQAIAEATELDIDEVRNSYKPVAFSSQVLFFCISALANIEPVYQYSLQWFISLFVMSLQRSERSKDVKQRMENVDEHFTYSLYVNICRSLLEKDKSVFSFLLTVRIMQSKGLVNDSEWLFMLTGGVAMTNPHANPCPDWLEEKNWGEVCRLNEVDGFAGLRDSFSRLGADWRKIYDSTEPEHEPFAGEWEGKLTGMSRLCMLRCLRSDKLVVGVQQFVIATSGVKFMKPPQFDLELSYNDSNNTTPLVFILSPGSDPMTPLFKLAKQMKVEVGYTSLGQGQGPIAAKLIEKARKDGGWAVMQNCMLAPSWMNDLERICEGLTGDNCHNKFRLWCTTYPTPDFPVSILQNGVKMTNEPPKGLRANIAGSYAVDPIGDETFFDSCGKGESFRALCYNLCFFHAVIQERRTYGPLGWNIPYEFNLSDLAICARQLVQFLDDNEAVPFNALKYTAGEANYGGRVTDDKDRICLNTMLDRFYNEDAMKPGASLDTKGIYKCPEDTSLEGYKEFIEGLPLVTGPGVVGLHDNANITKSQFETDKVLSTVLVTESSSGGSGGGGLSKEDMLENLAADILSKMPDQFDMEGAMVKYPVSRDESMNTVLHQELNKFNMLMALAKGSLSNLRKAVKGLVIMSSELDGLGNNLFYGNIPVMWKGKSFASLKPLGAYVNDMMDRLKFFGDWLNDKPPVVFWISGFFFPPAFLTASKQNFARKLNLAIDLIEFEFELMAKDTYSRKPVDGVYTVGFFFEGARWDKGKMLLEESLPKQLFSPAPIVFFLPMPLEQLGDYPHYNCPVYKTSDRRGILATTGHSTNFILFVKVPSDRPSSHWVGRGCAMISQLDN